MSTATAEKIYKEVKALRKENKTLKELVFLTIRDSEGEYQKSFIEKILKKSRLKPQFTFVNKSKFCKQISS